jgi:hypothetical protein
VRVAATAVAPAEIGSKDAKTVTSTDAKTKKHGNIEPTLIEELAQCFITFKKRVLGQSIVLFSLFLKQAFQDKVFTKPCRQRRRSKCNLRS